LLPTPLDSAQLLCNNSGMSESRPQPASSAKFRPNAHQRAYLSYCQSVNYRCSNREAADAAGIDEAASRRWHERNTGFSAWWNAHYQAHFTRRIPRVYGQLHARATGEDVLCDVPAAKLLIERYDDGYLPKSRQELAGRLGVDVDLSQVSQAELERMAHAAGDGESVPGVQT